MLSKRIPIIPHIIGAFGHRKITHSLIGVLILGIAVFVFLPQYLKVFLACYLSHLVLDTITPMGVPWLYPIKDKHTSLAFGIPGGITEAIYILTLAILFGSRFKDTIITLYRTTIGNII
jgi:membrane-bound metal-dependent hydrolase YbcI (DUF457 family)